MHVTPGKVVTTTAVVGRESTMLYILKNPGENLAWSTHLELGLTASGLEGGEGTGCTCTVCLCVLGKPQTAYSHDTTPITRPSKYRISGMDPFKMTKCLQDVNKHVSSCTCQREENSSATSIPGYI